MPREKAQAAPTARLKVPMRRRGTDCFVVVIKRGNARGAKGAGHRHLIGSTAVGQTGSRRNPKTNGRRQPWCDGTSRMMREYQVRICEGLGVKCPGPTRHSLPMHSAPVPKNVRCYPNSGQILQRSEMTRCAISDQRTAANGISTRLSRRQFVENEGGPRCRALAPFEG
jgi:hypothetical protein